VYFFFDVAYQAEKNVDNVNRRQLLYEAEFPVLTWSCHPGTLSIDDMLVAIRGGEIVLWSKKYGKRLVPRIASSYNYTRSDLAIYRFMCDLQYQDLTTNLNFQIKQLLPDLEHYPRVMYKDIIVSPAMWRLGTAQWDCRVNLEGWLKEKGISFAFRCGTGDQTLCFDPSREEDMKAFVHYRAQNATEDLYIEEALMGGSGNATTETGGQFMTQYVLNYFHGEQIYDTQPLPEINCIRDIFFPGSKWLYAEIYCHPSRSDETLTKYIRALLSAQKSKIEKWFFIRYADGGPHIRLRLQLKEEGDGITKALKLALEPLCRAGLISDIQIKTYFPETERYGHARMDKIEDFFHLDSNYVLHLLSKSSDIQRLYRSTVALMDRFCSLAFNGEDERLGFVRRMADSFSCEFSLSKADFKRINSAFEKLKKDEISIRLPRAYERSFCKILGDEKDASLLADLIHMHVNRVFHSGQRGHEAILYQYLLKLMVTRRFTSKPA